MELVYGDVLQRRRQQPPVRVLMLPLNICCGVVGLFVAAMHDENAGIF